MASLWGVGAARMASSARCSERRRRGSSLALVAVGPAAVRVDASWLDLGSDTRVPDRWGGRSEDDIPSLADRPFMRLVLADEIDESLIESLEARQAKELSLLVVVTTSTTFADTRPVALRLKAPVLMLAPNATFEDAVRAWFNPLAIRGLTGFYPEDMAVLARRAAVGWVSRLRATDVDPFTEFTLMDANAWLLHVTSHSLTDVYRLAGALQEATSDQNADMLFSAASSDTPCFRGALATLLTLELPHVLPAKGRDHALATAGPTLNRTGSTGAKSSED